MELKEALKNEDLEARINFIDSNHEKYCFVTKRNPLNKAQLYSFNGWFVSSSSNLKTVKTIIKNIFKKANVIDYRFKKGRVLKNTTKKNSG